MDKYEEEIGWIAGGLTVLYHLAPINTFVQVIRGRLHYEDSPGIFITTCYINSFLWFLYGDMIFSDPMKYCFLISAGVCAFFLNIYLLFEIKKYTVDSILNALNLVTGTWAAYRTLDVLIDDDRILGKICVCSALVVYLTPVYIIYKVIKGKNYGIIPFNSSIIYLLTCIAWVIYGIILTDILIIAPFSIGIFISLVQLCFYLYYKMKYPTIGEHVFSSTIGIENIGNENTIKEETKFSNLEINKNAKEKPVKIINISDFQSN